MGRKQGVVCYTPAESESTYYYLLGVSPGIQEIDIVRGNQCERGARNTFVRRVGDLDLERLGGTALGNDGRFGQFDDEGRHRGCGRGCGRECGSRGRARAITCRSRQGDGTGVAAVERAPDKTAVTKDDNIQFS